MDERCPHGGVRLPPVSDAFCGSCHGELPEPAGDSIGDPTPAFWPPPGEVAADDPPAAFNEDLGPDDVASLLRQIRDSAARHQLYIEERDRVQNQVQNQYLAAEVERVRRIDQLQRRGQLIWVLLVIALYLIAAAQFLR